ncbi:carbohydrate-binding domain-containing protein [Pseudomonas sp.]|uniref:carbohydrate-binding domain-containing protein n=1 Tax=Pseudomonas sp. TaxID=306 RepID=UPI0025FAE967|nr:carbohydrate-binding domain-containing protein [Pseudomonas sp.]
MVTINVGTPSPYPAAQTDVNIYLRVSEDAWQGHAQFAVSIDGQPIGDVFTTTAAKADGASDLLHIVGRWAEGLHSLTVDFLNDAYGGSTTTDRNLYINGGTAGVLEIPKAKDVALLSNGHIDIPFEIQGIGNKFFPGQVGYSVINFGGGPDHLIVSMSQDWAPPEGPDYGSALATIRVDGVVAAADLFAAAQHTLTGGPSPNQNVWDISGNWGDGPHTVSVEFTNDTYNPETGYDRNLYISSVEYNGVKAASSEVALFSNGSVDFQVGTGTPSSEPEKPDWDAIAARVNAYHDATGQWADPGPGWVASQPTVGADQVLI